ncbi:MAG: ABC transporter permease [Rhodobacteraceae bacterium]|nr:ABC transporter permease [Paracoccaceae bacterium]
MTNLANGAWNWSNTIHSIMLREVRCRFAGDPLGYAWTFLVPLLWIGTLMFFFTLLGRTPAIPVDTPTFIATGVVPYVLFRYTITSMGRVASTHRHLVHFCGVRVSDLLFAAAMLELLNAVIIFAMIWLLISAIFGPVLIHNPLEFINGLLLTAIFGASVGRFAAILGMVSETAKRMIPVVLRPMFWISGIFFTAPELPSNLIPYLQWNPLLHTIEITRSAVFLDYTSTFANMAVPLGLSAIFLMDSFVMQTAFSRGRDGLELT